MFWCESSGRIELNITKKDAVSCSHPGPCDNDVLALSNKPYIKRQLKKLEPSTVAETLREYGAWDDEQLKDYEENILRLLWIACNDIADEK